MALNIVETAYGKVQGTEITEKGCHFTAFKGIPYAAPPLGPLRWRPPEPPALWDGVRECTAFAPMAIQLFPEKEHFEPYYKDFYFMGYPAASEDCLYLNIYTGAQEPAEKRPVYIWLHGGGLSTGYSYEVEFNPASLVKRGIVVVQVGHRLNLFGSLALPQLSAEQGGRSGNYGLMDLLAALKWIHENIGAFGGDPDNITAGGQSGGTQKACVLAAVPASGGVIRRVIAQSGLKWPLRFSTVQEHENRCMEYLEKIGIDPNTPMETLRAMEPWRLYNHAFSVPEQMVYDGNLIPCAELWEIYEKYLGSVDFLCGTNFGEVSPYVSAGKSKTVPIASRQEFYDNYRAMLGDLYDEYQFEDLVCVTDQTAAAEARMLACRGLSALSRQASSKNTMLSGIFGYYRSLKASGSHVYNYIWSHILPAAPEDYGTERDPERLAAYHSSELWYVFDSIREQVPPSRPWRESDYKVADMACSYWANFIATGNVNGPGLPDWPEAGKDFGWLDIQETPNAHQGLDRLDLLILDYVKQIYPFIQNLGGQINERI